MRIAALAFTSLLFIAACEREATGTSAPITTPAVEVDISVSDELAELPSTPSGVAFWTHPNVAFNGLMIVADENGVVGYNIEDGSEVSRIPGVNAQGAAISYIGLGAQARGLLAYFDTDAGAFKIHAIDNASRTFQPVEGEISIRGAVRGFCFGRAMGAQHPSLHVVQRSDLTTYNFSVENSVVTAKADIGVAIPNDVRACAVDGVDGSVVIARENGRIHRMGADGPGAPLASLGVGDVGDVAVLLSRTGGDEAPSVQGQIILLDRETGKLHVLDRESGAHLALASVTETDEIAAVTAASIMGASGANLGGLYRNGAIALGVDPADEGGQAAIRLIPVNGLLNALDLSADDIVSPRGQTPEPEDNGLLIETDFVTDTD